MDTDLSLDKIEAFFTEQFHQRWALWSDVTQMIRMLEEKKLYREKGYVSISAWLAQVRMRTVSGGEFRYRPGRSYRPSGGGTGTLPIENQSKSH